MGRVTTEAELLAAFLGEARSARTSSCAATGSSRPSAPGNRAGSFDDVWERWLADGIVPDTGASPSSGLAIDAPGAGAARLAPLLARQARRAASGLEIAFAPDPKVFDGRFANNAWLQELPHPITKLTWDNAVCSRTTTAERAGRGDRRRGRDHATASRRSEAPVMIVPGHADDALTLPLGYGRAGAEHVGKGVGFNAGDCAPATPPGSTAAPR